MSGLPAPRRVLPPIPKDWVQDLFLKIGTRYGNTWANMWDGMDIDLVQDEWAEVLAPYRNIPGAIEHAINHLPTDWPPTMLQFVDLCRRAPRPAERQLPPPKANPAVVKMALAKARSVTLTSDIGPEWAFRMHARIKSGDLIPTQLQRENLRDIIKRKSLPLDLDF